MSELQWRYATGDDAKTITELFRTVYEDSYAYPDVYLPSMIQQHNASGHWASAVALFDNQVVGHSALMSAPQDESIAELALNVVHPNFRQLGIATFLGRVLLEKAKVQGLGMITSKQVSSTLNSQKLAQTLGFQSTGLLLDYVSSPSAGDSRETMVFGCLPLSPDQRPLPDIEWPERHCEWAKSLVGIFGSRPPEPSVSTSASFHMIRQYGRVDLRTDNLGDAEMPYLSTLPRTWLIHLKVRMKADFTDLSATLCERGFTFTGIEPAPANGWYGLFQRGFKKRPIVLHCSRTQHLLS